MAMKGMLTCKLSRIIKINEQFSNMKSTGREKLAGKEKTEENKKKS
jgi:hypothetical protein